MAKSQRYYFECEHKGCTEHADCPLRPSIQPICPKRTIAGKHGPMTFVRDKSTDDWEPKVWDKKRNPWDPTTW